jgi:hypothetical protein
MIKNHLDYSDYSDYLDYLVYLVSFVFYNFTAFRFNSWNRAKERRYLRHTALESKMINHKVTVTLLSIGKLSCIVMLANWAIIRSLLFSLMR